MDERDLLLQHFEAHRAHLQAVAYRLLGNRLDADDAVQESWLRLNRTDSSSIENLGGWLTTVVARLCLDLLRQRRSRRWESWEEHSPVAAIHQNTPEEDLVLADTVGLALLVVLARLTPAERIAFVLHDLFNVPFQEIAPIVGRTALATRQLASRARRRVRGATPIADADRSHQHEVVSAFLAASRNGDFAGLLALLDPDVWLQADAAAERMGGFAEIRGAQDAATFFNGRAFGIQPVLVEEAVGLIVAPGGRLRIVLQLTITAGKIVKIHALAEPTDLDRLKLFLLDA